MPGQCISPQNTVKVLLLDGKVVEVRVSDDTTTADVLEHICEVCMHACMHVDIYDSQYVGVQK